MALPRRPSNEVDLGFALGTGSAQLKVESENWGAAPSHRGTITAGPSHRVTSGGKAVTEGERLLAAWEASFLFRVAWRITNEQTTS